MSASPLIVDVAVTSPVPGLVRLYPLTTTGLPSPGEEGSGAGGSLCRGCAAPVRRRGGGGPAGCAVCGRRAITALFSDADAATTLARAEAALAAFCAEVAGSLGRDVVRSQLVAALSVPGVYRVNLVAPNADTVVPAHGWAHAVSQSVTLAGVGDD